MIGVVVREEDLAQVDQPDRDRSSWRCPSPQSKSRRSPPRRTRIALGARFAVGIEPAVPKKTRSRSTREGYARPVPGDDVRELLRRAVSVEEYDAIRELWKRHSIAEDERDLLG